jgi:hypothetical protein
MSTRWQRCPGKGRLGGQMAFAMILEVGEELCKELLGSIEPVAENATHGQIVDEGLAKSVHAASPGQGREIVRSASRSTLA